MFSCEFCEISNNTYSYRTPLVAASQCSGQNLYLFCKKVQCDVLVTYLYSKNRSWRSQTFLKIGVLKNFAIFTGKHACWSLFLIKLKTFSVATLFKRDSNKDDFLWILRYFYERPFYRTPLVAASDYSNTKKESRRVAVAQQRLWTWTLKNLDPEILKKCGWMQKNTLHNFINTGNPLRRAFEQALWKISYWESLGRRTCLSTKWMENRFIRLYNKLDRFQKGFYQK